MLYGLVTAFQQRLHRRHSQNEIQRPHQLEGEMVRKRHFHLQAPLGLCVEFQNTSLQSTRLIINLELKLPLAAVCLLLADSLLSSTACTSLRVLLNLR